MIQELLATLGEATAMFIGIASGFLPKDEYAQYAAVPQIRGDDENHLLVVEPKDTPRRLVLDEILGWQWYNSEGPEE